MFYQGDLQSGISKAVQESKLVACFVTDEGEESQLWENEFLQDAVIQSLLPRKAVLLRMMAGSQEASYLAAIFPLPKTPTLIVIRNGELKEYLVSGASKEDFLRRLTTALGGTASQISASTSTTVPVQPSTSSQPSSSQPSSSQPSSSQPSSSQPSSSQPSSSQPSSRQPSTSAQTARNAQIAAMLAERRAKLDVHKQEQEAAEEAKRKAATAARKEPLEEAEPSSSKASANKKYALMQGKRQQDAREERARILKRVEDDKTERREREAQRKAQASAAKELAAAEPTAMASTGKRSPTECALQVRLFDGSTIRSRFPAMGNLKADVRPWIDEQQEDDTPYTFKHVLTPLPNKNIEAEEEEDSLYHCGLTPNATLILVPVANFTPAYESGGILGRGFGLVSSGFGAVAGLLGSVLGAGGAAPPETDNVNMTAGPSNTNSTKVRTLRDQEPKKDDRQFYNGNALNFEPRKDDDDDQKKRD